METTLTGQYMFTYNDNNNNNNNNNNNDNDNNNDNNNSIIINNNNNNNNNNNDNNNNDNNLYLKRVTQSNGNDLPWGPMACLQVAWGLQGYEVVQYIAFRYPDLKEGRDGALLIASVKPFQTLGPEYEMHFWPIDLLHFGRANSEEVAFRVP